MDILLLIVLLTCFGTQLVIVWVRLQLAGQNSRLESRIEQYEQRLDLDARRLEGVQRIRKVYGDPISTHWGAPRLGYPAPAVELTDRFGDPIDLAKFQGTRVFVLFWSPGCSYCMQLMDDLKAWEEASGIHALKLLIVSTGPELLHSELNLRSPILLDRESTTMSSFGAVGTPSAVVIDSEGNIASTLARGGPAVLALLKRAPYIGPKRADILHPAEAVAV